MAKNILEELLTATISKGKSPFYPGQPVPAELFVGRADQIERIMTRGVKQVAMGKPIAMFVQGEYGIGKSSIAGFVQRLAERDHGLHGIYAPLGGAQDLADLAVVVMEATIRSGALNPSRSERIRNWLARYVGQQELFGFTLNVEALKKDAPNLSTTFGMLGFLSDVKERLEGTGVNGIFLILDEINGITANPKFAHFIKGLVDANAMAPSPVSLLLMICGVDERRREMIKNHQPVERIFDIIDIESMNEEEMKEFFTRAFKSVHMEVSNDAMVHLTGNSAGFPKIMHLIGDAAYWIDRDGVINEEEALTSVILAADDVGKKYVDQQVYSAIRSKDYHSILKKIGRTTPLSMSFTKNQVVSELTESEKKKFDNFLQKMQKLNVIRKGDILGEYIFNSRMVQIYIWLTSIRKDDKGL